MDRIALRLQICTGHRATARWSPDGRSLAFESVTQDYWQVGVLELPDGTPHMLTKLTDTNNGAPNWSRDGKWIYFYSGHDGGGYQLWKIPVGGGSPVRVTTKGGVYGIESKNDCSSITPNLASAGSGKNRWIAARKHACR